MNPAGLTVGPNGVVNVNRFIGTTLDITDENFLAGGALDFSGNSDADVTNLGTIRAATGDVHLIAKQVVNHGTLEAPNGTVGLTAATEVRIQPDGDQRVYIKPNSQKGGTVVNAGTVKAAAAEIQVAGNPYALAINLTGIVDVKGTAAKPAKVKILGGGGDVKVAATAKVSAQNADATGGEIQINEKAKGNWERFGEVEVAGTLDATGTPDSAAVGSGRILVYGNTVKLAETTELLAGDANAGGFIRRAEMRWRSPEKSSRALAAAG